MISLVIGNLYVCNPRPHYISLYREPPGWYENEVGSGRTTIGNLHLGDVVCLLEVDNINENVVDEMKVMVVHSGVIGWAMLDPSEMEPLDTARSL